MNNVSSCSLVPVVQFIISVYSYTVVQAKALAGESKSILQKKHYRTQKPKKL